MPSPKSSPKRVCVIGNSHITALRRYWVSEACADLWQPTFFGANTIRLKGLKQRDNLLLASGIACKNSFLRTSNGLDHIATEQYDCFYLSGTLSGSRLAKMIYQIDNRRAAGMPLSGQFVDELAREFCKNSLLQRLGAILRAATEKPIFASAGPLPSERLQDSKGGLRINSERTEAYTALLQYFENTISALAMENNVQYIGYPELSRSHVLYNAHKFMIGSQALSGKTNKEISQHDLIHGNADYGQLIFDQIADQYLT